MWSDYGGNDTPELEIVEYPYILELQAPRTALAGMIPIPAGYVSEMTSKSLGWLRFWTLGRFV